MNKVYLINHKIANFTKMLTVLVAILLLNSCEKEYELYTGDKYIQFGPSESFLYKPNDTYRDTAKSQTFVYEPESTLRDTMYFDVYAVGGVTDYDRPFVIEQEIIENAKNCIPGVHYVEFSSEEVVDEYKIKAGQAHMLMPVIFIRDTTLQTEEYMLKIIVKSNEHFKIGDATLSWRKAYIADILAYPSEWSSRFGKYSKVKHRFLIEVSGQNWDNEFFISLDTGAMMYWRSFAQNEISKYNRDHPGAPLTDEDGELVTI